jgi:hypothetical protein
MTNLNQFGLGHPTLKYWVYSLSSPTQVTVKCQEVGPPQNYEPTRQITLSNTGILPDSSSCYIYANKFKLLPHSLGRLTVSLNKTHIVLPNIDDILNVDERELLQNHSHALADLRPVKNIIERATSRSTRPGLDVSRLTTTLRNSWRRIHSVTMDHWRNNWFYDTFTDNCNLPQTKWRDVLENVEAYMDTA